MILYKLWGEKPKLMDQLWKIIEWPLRLTNYQVEILLVFSLLMRNDIFKRVVLLIIVLRKFVCFQMPNVRLQPWSILIFWVRKRKLCNPRGRRFFFLLSTDILNIQVIWISMSLKGLGYFFKMSIDLQ
jgi:hypothetical protein